MTVGTDISSLGLYTDKYQLTMAYAYFVQAQKKAHEKDIPMDMYQEPINSSELYFRSEPFKGGYAVCAGLEDAIGYINKFGFSDDDIAYLGSQTQNDGFTPFYSEAFLTHLKNMRFSCSVEAIPEGTVVFANQPLMRITGPRTQVQLLETALLNIVNFQTLIATKAARNKGECGQQKLLEFGLRRAQDPGGLAASRAAYIGGADASSNELAGKIYGIPTSGTHAHAWVMSFETELEAFRAYAEALPTNCIFLVDTYNVEQGIENAITVGLELREQGHEMIGIRLDSGDLAKLSKQARKRLDAAGFPKAIIVASNDLNEHTIASLKAQGAPIDAWGVGTQLATGGDQAALGGVYKVVATQSHPGTPFERKMKISGNTEKTTNPGRHQVRRYFEILANQDGSIAKKFIYDVMYDLDVGIQDTSHAVNPKDPTEEYDLSSTTSYEDLLVPVYDAGELVYELPNLKKIKERATLQLRSTDLEIKRLLFPQIYPNLFEKIFFELKQGMIKALRGIKSVAIIVTDTVVAVARKGSSPLPFFTKGDALKNETASDDVLKSPTCSLVGMEDNH